MINSLALSLKLQLALTFLHYQKKLVQPDRSTYWNGLPDLHATI